MILDSQNLYSDAQTITAAAASTNVVNLGQREVAFVDPVPLMIQVNEAFVGASMTSLTIDLQTDDNVNFTSPTTLDTETIPKAQLVVGKRGGIQLIPRGNQGYTRLYYTPNGGDATAGKITAAIVTGQQESYHNL